MAEKFTSANPSQALIDAKNKRMQQKAAAAPKVVLKGASAGGQAVQPDTIVNTATGRMMEPKPIVLQGASEGGVKVQSDTVVNPITGNKVQDINNQLPGVDPRPQDGSKGEWIEPDGTSETPVASQATESQQQGTTQSSNGIDIEALRASGLDQAGIDKILAIVNPVLNAAQTASKDNEALYSQEQGLIDENFEFDQAILEDQKARRNQIAQEEKSLIDYSAQVQSNVLEQSKALEQHIIEQDKARYEMDRSREERRIQEDNLKNEEQLTRDLAGSMGLAFSSFGTQRILELRQDGEQMLSDARAFTAIGKSEYAFRLADVERNYANSLNLIEKERRGLQVDNLNRLYQDIKETDSQLMLSADEKKEAAMESVRSFFERKEKGDERIANILSSTVKAAYDEVDAIKKEKAEAEIVDLELSAQFGYMVNKRGETVAENADGTPRQFVQDFDQELSAQFGYLVDKRGTPIRDGKGNRINYTDPSILAVQSAMNAFSNGTATEAEKSLLNNKVGTNSKIATTLEHGRAYKSSNPAWGMLQCGEYIVSNFLQAGYTVGSYMPEAQDRIAKYGGKLGSFQPQVGDVVYMDLDYSDSKGKIPHKAIIEGMEPNGDLILTDANRKGPGVVQHGWKVPVDSPYYKKIMGFARMPLKSSVHLAQPQATSNTGGTDGVPGNGSIGQASDLQKGAYAAALKKAGFDEESIDRIVYGDDPKTKELSFDDINKVTGSAAYKELQAAKKYQVALENFRSGIAKINEFQITGENLPVIQNLWTELAMAYKDKAGLGALTGPDLPLIKGIVGEVGIDNIADQAGLTAAINYINNTNKGGVPGIKKAMDLQSKTIENDLRDRQDQILMVYPQIVGTNLEEVVMQLPTRVNPEEIDINNVTVADQVEPVKNAISGPIEGIKGWFVDNYNKATQGGAQVAGEVSQQAIKVGEQTFKTFDEYKSSLTAEGKKTIEFLQEKGFTPDQIISHISTL